MRMVPKTVPNLKIKNRKIAKITNLTIILGKSTFIKWLKPQTNVGKLAISQPDYGKVSNLMSTKTVANRVYLIRLKVGVGFKIF